MKQKPHKREQEEFEIRVLRDGQVVMIAPDETMMEIAQSLDPDGEYIKTKVEKGKNATTEQTNSQQQKSH